MTKLVLSTGNVMSAGPSVIRKSGSNRSNLELVNSLRDNFVAAQEDYAYLAPYSNGAVNGTANGHHAASPNSSIDSWTERDGKVLYIPRINWDGAGLREDTGEYEITVKLFLLPDTPVAEREVYAKEALELVMKELRIKSVDLLVVSFPGMSFEGNCEWEADKINAQQGNIDEEVETWKLLENLHQSGLVKRLGVAEFGSEKLRAFMDRVTIHPSVDQINLKDCCNVPPPLKKLATEVGIELNVHTDSTDILPRGTLRELLSNGSPGAGILADSSNGNNGLQGEITPQWVVRYMAFVRDRGVIENKGYFAAAQLREA
ncbi:putative glutamate--cysteine ligase regulatory subunit [Paramyrothecium foliicola]|nr:putative glutamate--cysteine ligase regulatory subunit [Paramyrothecium foliicola]